MVEPTRGKLIDAASAYEALFVPALFRQGASKVADAAAVRGVGDSRPADAFPISAHLLMG